MELRQGQLIAERYRLDYLLGEGGMGVVWAATHDVTRKAVALKFLSGKAADDPQMRQRFLREARAACAVDHPNVVRIHDVLEDNGVPLMVMDLLQGESLGTRLDRENKLPLAEVARILLPVVSAVGTAHAAGIVHRDLKPDNIFVTRDADGHLQVTVLDFGIAKVTAAEGDAAQTGGLTTTGALLGTPYYMAPEQVFGEKDLDQRADIWALGVILYECLSGQRPTQADNVGQILKMVATGKIPSLATVAPDVPNDVVEMIGRMLQRDRDQRITSLREVGAVLRRYTDAAVRSFGDPAAMRSGSPSVPPKRSDAFAETLEAVAGRVTASKDLSTLASTTRETAVTRSSRRMIAVGGVGVAAAVVISASLYVQRGAPRPEASTEPARSTALPPAPSHSARPAPVETEPAASTSPTTSAVRPTVAPAHEHRTPPRNAASSASAAPVQSATPIGGVVDRPPF